MSISKAFRSIPLPNVILSVLVLISLFRVAYCSEKEDAADIEIYNYIMHVFLMFLCGSILALITAAVFKKCFLQPPISVLWFTLGGVFAGIAELAGPSDNIIIHGIELFGSIPASIIYMLLLPVLLYEGAVNTSWHKFEQMAMTSTLLAYCGVTFTTGVLAVLFKISFTRPDTVTTWQEAALLGAAISSTDPVAVISVLKSLNAPEKLVSMFEGESLLNDGTSVALYHFFAIFVVSGSIEPGHGTWLIVRLLFLGPIFGWLWSYVACLIVQNFHKQAIFQTIFLLSNCYLVFFVSEHYLGLSGPLTAVFFGLHICSRGRRHIEPAVFAQHRDAVSTLAVLSESAIFIISGNIALRVIITTAKRMNSNAIWGESILMYLYMILVRLAMFLVSYPFLRKSLYGFSWKELTMLVWGGLRGSIVLALALRIEALGAMGEFSESFSVFAVFTIATAVMLDLVINGTSFGLLFKFLNPYPCKTYKRTYLHHAMVKVDESFNSCIKEASIKSWWAIKLCDEVDILEYAVLIVPRLEWRKVNSRGSISDGVPSIRHSTAQVVRHLHRIRRTKAIRDFTEQENLNDNNEKNEKNEKKKTNVQIDDLPIPQSYPTTPPKPVIQRRASTVGFVGSMGKDGGNEVADIAAPTIMRKAMEEFFETTENVRLVRQETARATRLATRMISGPIPNEKSFAFRLSPQPSRDNSYMRSGTLEDARRLGVEIGAEEDIGDLHKERVSEVFIMACNAVGIQYEELKGNETLSGNAHAILKKSHDVAIDYASLYPILNENVIVGSLLHTYKEFEHRINRRHWEQYRNSKTKENIAAIESAFEVEWQVLRSNLTISSKRYHLVKRYVPSWLLGYWTRRAIHADTQAIIGFVSAHEVVRDAGGSVFSNLLQDEFMASYNRQVESAKMQLSELRNEYKESCTEAILLTVAIDLINLKENIIEEFASSGILMHEDKLEILRIFDEQRQKLVRWTL